ncbi:hypothetical protein BGW36DRAFT_285686 [Talaromyces proteolyticus]|uniref:Zn(2)-C6 fungal-type domain-containing protein n=1 Tax=Talaromyces proteolyticus TaxID=1131652 RepID=A0AAD4Q6D5_9EURO|nr:uncharacterized protein BGW36DRAFT_285686 [Talaromyces proteolyticus]KAH8705237.1 hypothetical protein BGW36DRAFT_285686 [Talaromyces proteolyticus]
MVGVAGKSKGCKTCRQRKIACGLQRPQCAQCIKSNRICLGYDRDVQFIPMQAKLTEKKLVVTSSFGEIRRSSAPIHKKGQLPNSTSSTTSKSLESGHSNKNGYCPVEEQPKHAILNPILDGICASANRQQLLNAFISICIPRDTEVAGSSSPRNGGPWLLLLRELSIRTVALEASISAISASVLGRLQNNYSLIKESLKLYTIGLRELQKALWNPRLMYNDEILAACLCLSLYEVLECPGEGNQAYYNHCKGCMRLVAARGVERHVSGIGHELFLGLRSQGILLSIVTRQPSFLSTSLWMEDPWKEQPKRPLDRLMDCLCEAPAIYKTGDQVETLTPLESLEFHLDSISKLWKIDATLEGVYDDFAKEFPCPMYWSVLSTEPSSADDPILGKVFPVAYDFPYLKVARSLMMYWSCRFLVWAGFFYLYHGVMEIDIDAMDAHCSNYPDCALFDDGMCHCRHLVVQQSGHYRYDKSHLKPLEFRLDLKSLVYNVCQSVEYCMKSSVPIFGVWSVTTPLSLVYETVKHIPGFKREVAWMEAALRKLQASGVRIIDYSTSINNPL